MARRVGYVVKINAFIPFPRDSFAAQAAAAKLMAEVAEKRQLSPEFLAMAEVVSVEGKYGSIAEAAAAPAPATPPAQDQSQGVPAAQPADGEGSATADGGSSWPLRDSEPAGTLGGAQIIGDDTGSGGEADPADAATNNGEPPLPMEGTTHPAQSGRRGGRKPAGGEAVN